MNVLFCTVLVQWYPFDTGMFISGGVDGRVKVWDTNDFEVKSSKRAL